jgi:predicted alpha/beta-fold hydrolase
MADRSDQHIFVPRKRLRGGHAQTLAGNFLRRANALPPGEQRIFKVHDERLNDDVAVLCECHWQPQCRTAITVVIVHGLEGSTESQYVVGTGSKAWLAGMNVVRMNMRNCGGTEKLTPTLYHSGMSGDIDAVLTTLIKEEALERVAVVGYSMGGNLALKLAGEYGSNPPSQLKVVATVSPAMDLAVSADALHHWRNRLYEIRFLVNLKRRFRRKAQLFPGRYDLRFLKGCSSIREFDHEITARYEGFSSADDYYSRSSSSRVAEHIAVPTLIIHALDDPFIRVLPETRAKLAANPNITFVETQHGGHCAFLAEPNAYDGRWAEKLVIEFIQKHA